MDPWLFPTLALAAGLLVGAAASWLVARARSDVGVARIASLEAQLDAARTEREAARTERDAARTRAEDIWRDRTAMVNEFRLLTAESLQEQSRRADEGAELRLRATERLMRPVHDSLERFNARLAEVERERAALAADLNAQVQAVRSTGDELRRETAALSTALRKPQVRGQWGELQLRRVVELAGMVEHCDFEMQATATGADGRTIRPDLKVTLAEGRFLYVDSKVPLAAFLDALQSGDDAVRGAGLARFAANVRTHVDQLAAKEYFKAGPASPEFVVLFLPSEALAAEALAQQPDLHEYAAHRNVVIATPTTLIAMLRAVAYGWRQAALSEAAAEVFALGRELADRLGSMGGHFDKLGRSLTAAVRAYNVTLGSLETRVLVTGRRLRDLRVTDADLASPAPVEELPRPVTAPELLEPTPLPGTPRLPDTPFPGTPPLPEAAELVRPDPGTDELLAGEIVSGSQGGGIMAG